MDFYSSLFAAIKIKRRKLLCMILTLTFSVGFSSYTQTTRKISSNRDIPMVKSFPFFRTLHHRIASSSKLIKCFCLIAQCYNETNLTQFPFLFADLDCCFVSSQKKVSEHVHSGCYCCCCCFIHSCKIISKFPKKLCQEEGFVDGGALTVSD